MKQIVILMMFLLSVTASGRETSIRSLVIRAQRNPKHIQHQFNLAEAYRKRGQCEKALPYYNKRIYNGSKLLAPVMFSMSKCYVTLGEPSKSHRILNLLLTHKISKLDRTKAMNLLSGYPGIDHRNRNSSKVRRLRRTAAKHYKVTSAFTDPIELPVFHTLIPYFAMVGYSPESVKDSGSVIGTYYSRSSNYKTLELFFENTSIKYKRQLRMPKLDQKNMGAFYSFFSSLSWKHRFGIHHISTTDDNSDGANMVAYSLYYYTTATSRFELDLYGTLFPNYNDLGVGVGQVALGYSDFGVNWDYFVRAHVIKTSANVELYPGSIKSMFVNAEMGFAYKWKSAKFKYIFSVGEKIFAVDNGGLNLYNTTEIYTSMHKFSYSLNLSKHLFVTGKYSKSFFNVLDSGVKGSSDAIAVLLGINF